MPPVRTTDTRETKVLRGRGCPTLLCRWKAEAACGCTLWVGIRLDNQEAATAAVPCRPGHRRLMERFNLLMGDSLVNPTDRPLIDVVAELLAQATTG